MDLICDKKLDGAGGESILYWWKKWHRTT